MGVADMPSQTAKGEELDQDSWTSGTNLGGRANGQPEDGDLVNG
jgi:hypothetical protein